jgi:hypothetical protein
MTIYRTADKIVNTNMTCPHCRLAMVVDESRLAVSGITPLKRQILILWTLGWQQKDIAKYMKKSNWCIHSHIDQACRLLGMPVDQRKMTLWVYGLEGKD